MRTEDLATPTIPIRYAALVLQAVDAHGVSADRLLAAAALPPDIVADVNGRISVIHMAGLIEAAIELTGQPGIGYEIGLSSSVTSHGIMGFGMMTSSSVREAIELGIEFLQLRVPVLSAHLQVDGDVAAVSVVETVPLGDLRQVLFDTFLVKLARIGSTLTDHWLALDDVELWFDYPEPDYYPPLERRLPHMCFDMGSNEVRFDASVLDRRPEMADPVNARLIEEQCRRELEALGLTGDVVGQVRSALGTADDRYPTLGEVAALLHTSSRTLKRRLHEHGTSYHELLGAARRADAIRLLTSTTLPVEQIAHRLGYADSGSFRRAFHSWTGTSPSRCRQEHRSAGAGPRP